MKFLQLNVSRLLIEPNTILMRHMNWLKEFKLKHSIQKLQKEEEKQQELIKFERIRELAKKDRQITKNMKAEYEAVNRLLNDKLIDKKTTNE